ncbi:hypothetical protein ABDK56_11975 [Sphingomonas sp. ASV193]|uniref:hypothetical protein n=1 Tax=Sphingomonas sp. ASV193 TaxID=3144405 RepID=UPI0032E8C89E
MGIFDSMLSQIGTGLDVEETSKRLNTPPEVILEAIAALGSALLKRGDTLNIAAASTKIPRAKLAEVIEQLGGPNGLEQFAGLLGRPSRRNPLTDKLDDFYRSRPHKAAKGATP